MSVFLLSYSSPFSSRIDFVRCLGFGIVCTIMIEVIVDNIEVCLDRKID